MASLKINLFGEFRVWRDEGPIESDEWGRQKARSLLKLLLTRPGYAFPRDGILEALWPGVPPKGAEHSLRMTVSLLRRTLEPDLKRGPDSRYILRKRPGYLFNEQADCEVDAWEVEKHRRSAEAAREAGELDEAITEYRAALDLAQGEFLAEDPYEDWAMEARQEWHERRLVILSNLAECLALGGRYSEAIEAATRALALDRYREDLHRRLMLYHYCAGEQAMALQAYRSYAKTLKEELGTAPSPELTRLKAQVEARDVPGVDTLRRYPRPRRPLRFPYSLGRAHFVGRERESALLTGRLEEASEGSGDAVAVEGEAGVGKTRLVEEFLGYAGSRNAHVLSGRCYERELGPPLEPVMDALELPIGEEEPIYLCEAEPYDNSARIYDTLTRKLVQESRDADHKAVVLFVDDVQWADPATLEFLSYLAKRISGERILLVVSYRREDGARLSRWLDHLAERRAITPLSLSRLSLENTTELLGRMSSKAFAELPSLAAFLHRESEGNPFYLVQYLRWLIEAGAVEIGPRRRISGLKSELLRESVLPSSVRSLLRSRISGLNEEGQDLLKLAAVIGRSFDLGLLCKAADRGEAGVFGTMGPLMTMGLIAKSPAETYQFSHDKLRQAFYEDIGGPRRRALHLRVAGVLEEDGGAPAELAHHYLRARAWRPALENLVRAAWEAEKEYAWEMALRNYGRALDVVDELPSSEGERFELLAARDSVLERMGRQDERTATIREMFDLARRLEDRAWMAEAHVRRVRALAALPDPNEAAESGRAAVVLFRKLGNKAGEARAHRETGYVSWVNRDYDSALQANLRARELHRKTGDRQGEAGDAGNLAQVYRSMGNEEEALRWMEEADRIYAGLGDEANEMLRIDTMAAAIHRHGAEATSTIPLSLESLRVVANFGVKDFFITQSNSRGTLYLDIGGPEEALEHFRSAAYFDRKGNYSSQT
ncbi:MAG: AAA family ATPase [Actinomycetota bacterium]|nr:AAA family ATPase [Actinomycetota bacterium]